jgi:hypothetical protein
VNHASLERGRENRLHPPLAARRAYSSADCVLSSAGLQLTNPPAKEANTVFSSILIIFVVAMLLGSLPTWGYSRSWGYTRSRWFGLATVILFILLLIGWI